MSAGKEPLEVGMWPVLLAFLASILAGGVALRHHLRFNRRRLGVWLDAIAAVGLQVEEISSCGIGEFRLTARRGPLELRIERVRGPEHATRVVVVVLGPPGFSGVWIRRELFKTAGGIEVGDERFDHSFSVDGPIRHVRMLLDAEARRLLLGVKCRLEVACGELRADMSDDLIPDTLPLLLELGQRFAQRLDVAQRLAENAQRDPQVGVRLRNLLVLAREFPGKPGTIEALRRANSDASPEIRLRAAMELGAEGRDVVVALAESEDDDSASAQAISFLGRDLPFEQMKAIFAGALYKRRMQTARACLAVLGKSGDAAAVGVLTKVLAREKGELAAAAALALGTTGSPEAEPPLILALRRQSTDLRVQAAKALGSVGSLAAILPLKEAVERPADPEVRQAIRQAIAEIQFRLPGASPGQLSLAGAEAGQLSLAGAEAGQLSLSQGEAGQLALADDPAGRLSRPTAERGGA